MENINEIMETSKFGTTEMFWDCECKEHYIHYRKSTPKCFKCGCHNEDQPDSIVAEVELEYAADLVVILNKS